MGASDRFISASAARAFKLRAMDLQTFESLVQTVGGGFLVLVVLFGALAVACTAEAEYAPRLVHRTGMVAVGLVAAAPLMVTTKWAFFSPALPATLQSTAMTDWCVLLFVVVVSYVGSAHFAKDG